MAYVRWCASVEGADNHEIVCLARTPPVRWDLKSERIELPAEELRALVDAEHELVRLVTPVAQLRMHADHELYVGRRSLADHCRGEREFVEAETLADPANAALVPTGLTDIPVRLQLILRKRNLTYGLRSGHDDSSAPERFSVGWELDAVLYEDKDWPF
jgi:hypothetical protein